MCSKLYCKGIIGGPRFPAQAERLLFERTQAYPAVLIQRRVIERARRTRLCTRIVGRAGTRGMFHPLPIRPRLAQRRSQFIRIRTFSAGSEPTQQRPPKPFDFISARLLEVLKVTRLIGLLVLLKVERVIEQESDLCYGRGAVCELVAVQEERLEHRRDVEFFVDLEKEGSWVWCSEERVTVE